MEKIRELSNRLKQKLDEGLFNENDFNDFLEAVVIHNSLDLDTIVRKETSSFLWRTAFKIQLTICNHLDVNDVYEIENFKDEYLYEIPSILKYVGSWFESSKVMEVEALKLGFWK